MSTLAILREQTLRTLANRDRSKAEKVDPREVELKLCQLSNYKARLGLWENMKLGDNQVDGQFITTFPSVAVVEHPTYGGKAAKLPAKYVSLPHDKGIDWVSKTKDRANYFIPKTRHAAGLFANNMAGGLEGREGYFPENGWLILDENTTAKSLLIRLVIADATLIDEDADFPCPADYEDALVSEAVQWFLGIDAAEKQLKKT